METIITITGPSCSGKTTLAAYLEDHGVPEVRSFTTRQPRPAEQRAMSQPGLPEGPYKFVTREWVNELDLESVIEKVEFNGNIYGNTVGQLNVAMARSKHKICTVVVEPLGVDHWRLAADRLGIRHVSFFLEQNAATLVTRFSHRFTNLPADKIDYEVSRMRHMLDVEQTEWRSAHDYDYVFRNLGAATTRDGDTQEQVLGLIRHGLTRLH